MIQIAGYIVELMNRDGELEILSRDYTQPELTVIRTKLDQHPIVKKAKPEIEVQYRLDKSENIATYRYKGKREIKPHWINIIILPETYSYCTYRTNLPIPKPKTYVFSSALMFHIGTGFYHTTDNNNCFYYINPNSTGCVNTMTQMDIAPFTDTLELADLLGQLHDEHTNLIDKTITQANTDRKDKKIIQHNIVLTNQHDVIYHFSLAKPKFLIKALRKIPHIKVTSAGGHQHKATNMNNNRSAPIPWHSRELDHHFPSRLAKELDIPYEVLLAASK